MREEMLFDGDRLKAVLFDPGADKLIVTFDFRMTNRTGFVDAKPAKAYVENGFAQLFMKVRVNDWFINPETPAIEEMLGSLAMRYRAVHALGWSMGGYGAFRFAPLLGARNVIAVSPQFSIDPDLVPWEWRYKSEGQQFDKTLGAMPRDDRVEGAILVDPRVRLDLRHALLLQDHFPKVRIVRATFGGHPASRVISEAKRGWVIQREARADTPSPAALSKAHRTGRRDSIVYWKGLAKSCARRRPSIAAKAIGHMARLHAAQSDQGG